MDMPRTYQGWLIWRNVDCMEWRVMIVMFLCKHSFHYLIEICCQKGYEMHSRRSVISLEIYAPASLMLITLKGLKQISSRQYANMRWYSLHHFLTQWSIYPYIYCLRQKLEDWSSIDGCIHSNGKILQLQCNSYIKVFSLFFFNWKYLINFMQVLVQS